MGIELLSDITDIEVIAVNRQIRNLAQLRKQFGRGRWRKLKGLATVRLDDGTAKYAELHWYEAEGIGKRLMKVKQYLDK